MFTNLPTAGRAVSEFKFTSHYFLKIGHKKWQDLLHWARITHWSINITIGKSAERMSDWVMEKFISVLWDESRSEGSLISFQSDCPQSPLQSQKHGSVRE